VTLYFIFLQDPTTGYYPELVESSLHPHTMFCWIHFNIIFLASLSPNTSCFPA